MLHIAGSKNREESSQVGVNNNHFAYVSRDGCTHLRNKTIVTHLIQFDSNNITFQHG